MRFFIFSVNLFFGVCLVAKKTWEIKIKKCKFLNGKRKQMCAF